MAGLTKVQIKEIENFIADNNSYSKFDRAITKAVARNKTEERKNDTSIGSSKTGKEPEFWDQKNRLFINNLSKVVATYDKHASDVTDSLLIYSLLHQSQYYIAYLTFCIVERPVKFRDERPLPFALTSS